MKNPKFHPSNEIALSPARPTILDLVDRNENPRRRFFKGSVAGTAVALMGGITLDSLTNSALAAYSSPSGSPTGGLGFSSVPVNKYVNGAADDKVTVPDGYTVRVLCAWGDPVSGGPQLDPTVAQTEANQVQQYGMNVDGMSFFPFAARGGVSSDRGLLAVVRYETGRRDAAIAGLDWFLEHQPPGIDIDVIRTLQDRFRNGTPPSN
jgi:secreted PhoX family phosphatase